MEKDTNYRKYLEALKKSTKKVKMEQALKSPGAKKSYAIMSKITGKSYKGNERYEQILKDYKKTAGVFPKVSDDSFTSRRMKLSGAGIPDPKAYFKSVGKFPKVSKVGEDFVKRRMSLAGAGNVLSKIPRVGKIIGAAIAGYGAAKLGEKDKKMGGGMMYKYKSGGLSPKQKKIARMAPPPDKITGDDFKAMKTMKAKSGAMVYVKTKIGKNKPTKIC